MKPAIVIMSRVPRPGKTKTRLMTKITAEECALLHRACLEDIYRVVESLDVQGYVYFDAINELGLPEGFIKRTQLGDDLGERLYNAAVEVLTMHERVIFLGSDLPDLNVDLLKDALQRLTCDDIVLGPSVDGGYYLVGLKFAHRELFSQINWGSSVVLAQTLKVIRKKQLSCNLLDIKRDIDTWEDLISFWLKVNSSGVSTLATYEVAKNLVDRYGIVV